MMAFREVTLVVEGVDKYNNLFATVQLLPSLDSLSELLVKEGLAKVSDKYGAIATTRDAKV
jgi:endonuclease YncB( thermonuclease family)